MKSNRCIAIGGYEYYLSTVLRGRTLELTFDPMQGTFLGQPEGSDTIITIAPQGLSKTELMGELSNLLTLPVYQLALPRAGVEGTIAQSVRSTEVRRTRYIGQAKTHLQHVMSAAIMNVVRMLRWLADQPKAKTPRSRFAQIYQNVSSG